MTNTENLKFAKCYTNKNAPTSGGCARESRAPGAVAKVTQCGNQCCSSDSTGLGLGDCGHTLGYAQVGNAGPCARYSPLHYIPLRPLLTPPLPTSPSPRPNPHPAPLHLRPTPPHLTAARR